MNRVDEWLKEIILGISRVLRLKLNDKAVETLVQFIKFGVIGVSNTLVSYVLNVLVLLILRPYRLSWDYVAGNVVAFVLSVLWSFYWNHRFVFTDEGGEKRNLWWTLLKTYLAYGFTGIVLNNLLSYVWINRLGVSKFVAPLINLIISVPLNFIINKFWAFRK